MYTQVRKRLKEILFCVIGILLFFCFKNLEKLYQIQNGLEKRI